MTYHDLSPELQEAYADLDDESKSAPLEWRDGVLRFKSNAAVRYALDHTNLSDMWIDASRNEWPREDIMSLYRQMGYSLCGFCDVFGEHMQRKETGECTHLRSRQYGRGS